MYNKIEEYFKECSDKDRQIFNKRIINTNYYIHGLRNDEIRKALELIDDYDDFLRMKNFESYEMMFLYSEVIAKLKDTSKIIAYLRGFLPLVDNWAIIDNLGSRLKKIDKTLMLEYVKECLESDYEFIKRFGVVMFINGYLREEYLDLFFDYFDRIDKSQYYVMMAVAWAIASAYVKYKDRTLEYLDNNHLDDVTFNKAISKINDSYKVTREEKEMLRRKRR